MYHYSPQDIEQFKAEIEKRQLKDLPIPGLAEASVKEKSDGDEPTELKDAPNGAES